MYFSLALPVTTTSLCRIFPAEVDSTFLGSDLRHLKCATPCQSSRPSLNSRYLKNGTCTHRSIRLSIKFNGGHVTNAVNRVTSSMPGTPVNVGNAQSMVPKLSIRNLGLTARSGEMILEGITLDINPGELYGLIGPSGSGKSTVLRALNRLWEPPRGTVFLDGEDVTKVEVKKLRMRVGMVFQSPFLFEGSVGDNVRFGPALSGRHLSDEEACTLLLRAGVDASKSFLSKASRELSGGEAQRVAIARALAVGPEVLLLDEPTSSLDPSSTRRVEETIVRLRDEEGLTVVLVSHSMEQIGRLADTTALLTAGRILEVGHQGKLRASLNPAVARFFTGELK